MTANDQDERCDEQSSAKHLAVVLAQALVVGGASGALAVYKFRAWQQSYWVAFMAAGTDHLQMAAVIRSIHDTGWYFTNPHLGAPFGQQLYDFPQTGESLQIVGLRILTLFSDRPFWVMNVYFLSGFVILAAVTYLVLAHLRFRFLVAAPIAFLYTWLPYHFMHGEFHMFRSMYLSAPIAVLIMFWTLSWKDRFLVDPSGPVWGVGRLWRNVRWWRVTGAVALCAFVGSFETMVMAFTLVALLFGALIATIRNRDIGDFAAALCAGLIIAGTFGLLFIPNYSYKATHGPNHHAAKRYPSEQTTYGLQIAKMVLPVPDHRIKALSNLWPRAQEHSPAPGEAGQSLGTLGALGFFGLLFGVIANGLDTRAGPSFRSRRRLWVQSGMITLILVLFATMSGLALVLSVLGFSQIRVWDRAVVLIGFCSLLLVAIALEKFLAFLRRKVVGESATAAPRLRRLSATGLACLLAVAVTGFGLWDTRTTYAWSATNQRDHIQAMELRKLDEAIAAQIGPTGMVFQLPIVAFPEAPPRNAMLDYEGLLPFLFSNGLRFSYGATRGRPTATWQHRISSDDPVASLAGLVGLGFDGVLVDRTGYSDAGASVSKLLTTAIGEPVVSSDDGRWTFWTLEGYAQRHSLSTQEVSNQARRLVGPKLYKQLAKQN